MIKVKSWNGNTFGFMIDTHEWHFLPSIILDWYESYDCEDNLELDYMFKVSFLCFSFRMAFTRKCHGH